MFFLFSSQKTVTFTQGWKKVPKENIITVIKAHSMIEKKENLFTKKKKIRNWLKMRRVCNFRNVEETSKGIIGCKSWWWSRNNTKRVSLKTVDQCMTWFDCSFISYWGFRLLRLWEVHFSGSYEYSKLPLMRGNSSLTVSRQQISQKMWLLWP